MRPRALTVAECRTCNLANVPAALREMVALHRLAHRRADHRRSQWRAYKRRSRDDGRIGALHSLSCAMPRRCTCRAIPVYAKREAAA